MLLAASPLDLIASSTFLRVPLSAGLAVNLKLEGFSITGSIKIKSAMHMIARLEASGRLKPGMRVIESSSGNLGLALAMICAVRQYPFTCVTDPNISPQTASLIRAYGAELIVVRERDENGGYLGSRINLIKASLQNNDALVWINQYENEDNVLAHYQSTGPEILAAFPEPDVVFVGAGTTGTLGGVSRFLREHSPRTRIIAVDSVGSVTFGGKPGKRMIPGLGTSAAPPISRHSSYNELIRIPETATVEMCRRLARQGMLFGGSTGTVLCAVEACAASLPQSACVVAISPDFGDRYVDTLYSDEWVGERFKNIGIAPIQSSAV